MQQSPRSHALRIGRYSIEGQIYLVTASTAHREPCFLDFGLARQAVLALRQEEIMGRARTLSFVIMPDHLHWLLTLRSTAPLGRVVGSVRALSMGGRSGWRGGRLRWGAGRVRLVRAASGAGR